MRCHVCKTERQTEGETCTYCGAVVYSVLGKGMPIAWPISFVEEVEEKERRADERRRRRLKRHVIVGAVVFCVFALTVMIMWTILFAVATMAVGAATGEVPRGPSLAGLILSFLATAVVSPALGGLMGYVLSRRNLGMLGGGLAGGAMCAAALDLVSLPMILWSSSAGLAFVVLTLIGFAVGTVPGILIGFHVHEDSA